MMKFLIGILLVGAIWKLSFDKGPTEHIAYNLANDSLGQVIEVKDFGATLHTSTHKTIEDLLSSIQNKYKGKSVILDLWGTFCKPCLSDFKNSPAIKAQLKEMDVHMVYLCAGQSSQPLQWKKVIDANKLVGDHIYLDSKLCRAYMDKFKIRNYPNYILINKNGEYKTRIISAVGDINIEKFKEHL